MRYLIISDIHSNLEALSSALKFINPEGIDKVICLGDIIGYMTDPNECISLVKDFDCIIGNHDYAVFNNKELEQFNKEAHTALLWTKGQLSEESKNFLKDLPFKKEYDLFTVSHGSIVNPEAFSYIEYNSQIRKNLNSINTPILFVGHTHIPIIERMFVKHIFYETNQSYWALREFVPAWNTEILLDRKSKYLINVGSIGQPRDSIPKGCCVVFDTDSYTIKFLRFDYNMDRTVQKMIENNMPDNLYHRLIIGR